MSESRRDIGGSLECCPDRETASFLSAHREQETEVGNARGTGPCPSRCVLFVGRTRPGIRVDLVSV